MVLGNFFMAYFSGFMNTLEFYINQIQAIKYIIFIIFLKLFREIRKGYVMAISDSSERIIIQGKKTCFEIKNQINWNSSYKAYKKSFLADFKISKDNLTVKKHRLVLNEIKSGYFDNFSILEKISELAKINSVERIDGLSEFILGNFNLFKKINTGINYRIEPEDSLLNKMVANSSIKETDTKETSRLYFAKPGIKKLRFLSGQIPYDYSRGFSIGNFARKSGKHDLNPTLHGITNKNYKSVISKNYLVNFFLSFKPQRNIISLNKVKKTSKAISNPKNTNFCAVINKLRFIIRRSISEKGKKSIYFIKLFKGEEKMTKLELVKKIKLLGPQNDNTISISIPKTNYPNLLDFSYVEKIQTKFFNISKKIRKTTDGSSSKSTIVLGNGFFQITNTSQNLSVNKKISNYSTRKIKPKFYSNISISSNTKKFRSLKELGKKTESSYLIKRLKFFKPFLNPSFGLEKKNSFKLKCRSEGIKSKKSCFQSYPKSKECDYSLTKLNHHYKEYRKGFTNFFETSSSLILPCSSNEENKTSLLGCRMGDKNLMMDLAYRTKIGAGIQKIFASHLKLLNSARKRGLSQAWFEHNLLSTKKSSDLLNFKSNCFFMEKLKTLRIDIDKTSSISNKREKFYLAKVILASLVSQNEYNNLRLLYASFIMENSSNIPGKIFKERSLFSKAIDCYSTGLFNGSINAKFCTETILRETRQSFLLRKFFSVFPEISSKKKYLGNIDNFLGINVPRYTPDQKMRKIFQFSNLELSKRFQKIYTKVDPFFSQFIEMVPTLPRKFVEHLEEIIFDFRSIGFVAILNFQGIVNRLNCFRVGILNLIL